MGKSIYLIANCGIANRYKIGITNNISDRLNALQLQGGSKMRLIHSRYEEYDYAILEKLLHKLFDSYRVIGEWFEFPDEMLSEVVEAIDVIEPVYRSNKPLSCLANSLGSDSDEAVKLSAGSSYVMEYKVLDLADSLESELKGFRFPLVCTRVKLLELLVRKHRFELMDYSDLLAVACDGVAEYVLLPSSSAEFGYYVTSVKNWFSYSGLIMTEAIELDSGSLLTLQVHRVSANEANMLCAGSFNCKTAIELRVLGDNLGYSYYIEDSLEALKQLAVSYPPVACSYVGLSV